MSFLAAARQETQTRKGQTVTVSLYGDSVAQLGAAARFLAGTLRETSLPVSLTNGILDLVNELPAERLVVQ